jgi:predicted metal-dependent hydrolase
MESEDFLYGIDLYNFAYWWESHEVFEGLWHAAGHQSEQGRFFQAFIHLAAAHLKRFTDQEQAANRLFVSGLARLERLPPLLMGVDVARLRARIRAALADPTAQPILVRLLMA